MASYRTVEVFTPTKPARVAFIERTAVNDKLVNALSMPGKQIVVYGHSGSGKTTLLVNKLNQVYERHIVTRCMKAMTFEQIILDGFDQLAPFYNSERSSSTKATTTVELATSYLAIQSKLNSAQTTEESHKAVRILPPQLTAQALGRFMGVSGHCWILEDFHKVEESEKTKLSQLMKIFMDLADEYEDLKIVALGAVDTARQVVDYDPEMRNRVAEIHVDLMTEEEIEAVIEKGETALNVVISKDIKALIARYSNGLASVCHHICLYMCNIVGVTHTCPSPVEFSKADFEGAIKVYVEETSDSIRSAFDKALKQRRKSKFDNPMLIIKALGSFKERGASRIELMNRIKESVPSYPSKNIRDCLPKLLTPEYGSILRHDQNSGLYSFSDAFNRAYALTRFRASEPTNSIDIGELLQELSKVFTQEFQRNFPKEIKLNIVKKR